MWDGVEDTFKSSVERLRLFIETHERIPKYGGDIPNEKIIYGFMQRVT